MVRKKQLKQGLIVLSFLMFGSSAWASRSLDSLAEQALLNDQSTQQLREEWSQEQAQLAQQIKLLQQQSERLNLQSQRLERALKLEDERIAEQQRRLIETERVRDGLLEWLLEVCQTLEHSTQQGLPFLAAEREQRIASLHEVLADTGIPMQEQFRRVFEALLIEAEYAYSNEVYRGDICLAGETVQVDLLRIGRLALLYRTLDRQSVGLYDLASGDFTPLSDDYLADIERAFTVVRREAVAEMTLLPIGRIIAP
jgi:hypothetical protein